jgi:hypothetical protein
MSQSSPQRANRRTSTRQKPRGARIRCLADAWRMGPDIAVTLLDVSQGGACCTSQRNSHECRYEHLEIALELVPGIPCDLGTLPEWDTTPGTSKSRVPYSNRLLFWGGFDFCQRSHFVFG